MRWFVMTLGSLVLLFSCVSKKVHHALLAQNEELSLQVKSALDKSEKIEDSYEKLRDNLLTQNSLNNILLAEQNKLQSEVKALEERLGSVSSEAQNRQNALNKELSEQNKNLSQKQARLKLISDAFQAVRSQQESLLIQLTKLVEDVNDFDLEVQMVDRTIVLIFYDKFTFNGPSALSTSALRKLDQLVKILLDKTHLTVQIVGHTGPDVAIVDKRWTDPLDVSMFKAGILTRYILEQGLTISILTAGQGLSSPRVSNETTAGKELNNRTEIHFLPNWQGVFKLIEQG